MEADIKELMCYLWDNYLQLYNAEKIFIMGIGYAYIGVKMLLLNRSDASPPGKFSTIRAEWNAIVCSFVKSLQEPSQTSVPCLFMFAIPLSDRT